MKSPIVNLIPDPDALETAMLNINKLGTSDLYKLGLAVKSRAATLDAIEQMQDNLKRIPLGAKGEVTLDNRRRCVDYGSTPSFRCLVVGYKGTKVRVEIIDQESDKYGYFFTVWSYQVRL